MATRELIDTATTNVFSVSRYADLNAAITAIGATDAYLLIDATTATNGNVTIPDNVHTIFMEQGDITGTDTVTFNGPVTDFEKDEVVSVAFAPNDISFPSIGKYITIKRGKEVDVSEYGVNAVGDESSKIQNIMEAVGDAGQGQVYFPPLGAAYTCIDVQVPSYTKVRGAGMSNPYSGHSGTKINAASHSGDKAIFYVDAGGIDPQPTLALNVHITGIRFNGPGEYVSQATKGLWIKKAVRCNVEWASYQGFPRQAILCDAGPGPGFGAHVFKELYLVGVQAIVTELSDVIGTLELHCGECWCENLQIQGGHNQIYPTNTNLYMCSILDTFNTSWYTNCAADQSDIGIYCNAGSTFTNCRTFECWGHGWVFDQYTGEGVGSGTILLGCRSQDSGQHATNTFDNFIINNTGFGRMTWIGCQSIIRDSPTWVPRYGFNDQGPALGQGTGSAGEGAVDNRNDFIACHHRNTNAGTANYNSRTISNAGPLVSGKGGFPTDQDTTPSVEQVSTLVFNNSVATTITDFDDGAPFQVIHVMDPVGNTTIQDGTNINMRAGANLVFAAGDGASFMHYNGKWAQI